MSCPCCARYHGYPSGLEGWRYYEWPTSIGGDNMFLQHTSGVRASGMYDARKLDKAMREKKKEDQKDG